MNLKNTICCPCTKKSKLNHKTDKLLCSDTDCIHAQREYAFPVADGKPILISEVNCDTVCEKAGVKTYVNRTSGRLSKLKATLGGRSSVTLGNCKTFVEKVTPESEEAVVLIVGAGTPGSGTDLL